ncbi:tetratricopeptide repeat protein [Pullulanibacillus sp. KACC 23026]|uniref:tetratricopeptide repeat protein n=1 Tax=Pullulanibacillus sp. KACC 23026 TaxID=3028315 RepID=UPI0023B08CCF|nr:tetratricopeptide repeat protein [Pullulanibacillus sp. KACC 23026]WEG13625.1 tetratricopeptide repeat protein [Pullulanibacillus sp. KACC 23026]
MKPEGHTNKARVIPFLPDGDYYFEKGIVAYQHGDLGRAKKFLERAVAFNPNEPDYLCQLAAILAELEQFEASNQLLKKVVFEIDPSLVECFFFMANNFAYLGRYEEAIQEIKRYMTLEPHGSFVQDAKDLYKLLMLESGEEIGEVDPAISDHEKGRQALERGDQQKAIYYFKKVIKEKPSFWAAQNNLAIAYFSLGQQEKGLNQIEHILAHDPGNVHALCNKITFHHQLGDAEVVKALLELLNKLQPFYPEMQSKLGATYFLLGEDEKAYKWLKKAERSGLFEDQTFYYWLAVSSYHLGKVSEALRAWKQVDFFSESPFPPFEYGKIKDLLKEEDAEHNPLVRSLLDHELKEGDMESKLVSLFLLHYFADEVSVQTLEEMSSSQSKGSLVAGLSERLKQHLAGHPLDESLSVMMTIQKVLDDGKPIISDTKLYSYWYQVCSEVSVSSDEIQAMAAAIVYRWFNTVRQIKMTQAECSQTFNISLYKLRQQLFRLDQIDHDDVFIN